MRQFFHIFIFLMLLLILTGIGHSQEIELEIENTWAGPGDVITFKLNLDNSSAGEVRAVQSTLSFERDNFSLVKVERTDRSAKLDIFACTEISNRILFACVGTDHPVTPGTGSIADISVRIANDAIYGMYCWKSSYMVLSNEHGFTYGSENGSLPVPWDYDFAFLSIDFKSSDGETLVLEIYLDNSTAGEVAAGEMVITFDRYSCTVFDVQKTERSSDIDLFLWSDHVYGISFVFTGIGHSILPGTGAIAELYIRDRGCYNSWCIDDGSILADPYGNEIEHETSCLYQNGNLQERENHLPGRHHLFQNYPNPFNAETVIEFTIPEAGPVTLTVSNMLGQIVDVLLDESLAAGCHRVSWQGEDVPNGVYLYTMNTNGYTSTRRMILLK